jgi:hypothetical protein
VVILVRSQGKENVENTTKQTKNRTIRRAAENTLKRNTALQSNRGLNIDEIGGCGNNLIPKVRWKRSGDHQRSCRLKKMVMLALSHTILSISTETRELIMSTLLG